MSKITMSIGDDALEHLDDWAGKLGQSRSATAEIAIRWWLAVANGSVHTKVLTNVLTDAPDPAEKPQVPQNQAYTPPAKTPHRGMLPTDTDEILALLEELNAMPDATEVDGDHLILNGLRKADIQRDIRRLRISVAEKRAQVAQNQ